MDLLKADTNPATLVTVANQFVVLDTTRTAAVPAAITARLAEDGYSDINEHQYKRICVVNLVNASHQWDEQSYIYEYISMDEENSLVQMLLLTTALQNLKTMYHSGDWPRENTLPIKNLCVAYQVVVQDINRAAFDTLNIAKPTPIATAIRKLFSDHAPVVVPTIELASKVVPIKIPLDISQCSKYVGHLFCMTSPTQLEIFPMDQMCAITSILWCMTEVGWVAEA